MKAGAPDPGDTTKINKLTPRTSTPSLKKKKAIAQEISLLQLEGAHTSDLLAGFIEQHRFEALPTWKP